MHNSRVFKSILSALTISCILVLSGQNCQRYGSFEDVIENSSFDLNSNGEDDDNNRSLSLATCAMIRDACAVSGQPDKLNYFKNGIDLQCLNQFSVLYDSSIGSCLL